MADSESVYLGGDCGVLSLTEYGIIDERDQGHVTFMVEAAIEERDGHPFLRLMVTEKDHSRRGGEERKTLVWPIASANSPVELLAWGEKLLAAAMPGAPCHDNRNVIDRISNSISGLRFINHLDELDSYKARDGTALRLSATLYEDKFGKLVVLTLLQQGKAPVDLRLPQGSLRALRRWVENLEA